MKTSYQPNTDGSKTWQGADCFTHMLVVGPTRTGKSSSLLEPIIYQLLLQRKMGKKLGLTVIEPKGDVARLTHDMASEMDMVNTHIDPVREDTHRFNSMEGELNSVIESTVSTLQGLFGEQEAFFTYAQELAVRYIVRLLKTLDGDGLNIMDVLRALRDPEYLEDRVHQLRERDAESQIVKFFDNKVIGDAGEKFRDIITGLHAQLENITNNDLLQRVMVGKSDIDMDTHLAEGGILSVNTAAGEMGKSGDAFGQFLMMHLQNATLRRPGTEKTRTPHYVIIDEFSFYVNPEIKRFLAMAAGYRVSVNLATQSLGDLEVASGMLSAKAVKQAVMTNCRNKIAFGGLGAEDAKEFAEEFGTERVTAHQGTFANKMFSPKIRPDSYREVETDEYRFSYDYLMFGMPRFHFVHKMVDEGIQQQPEETEGMFIPLDWRERREWETSSKGGQVLDMLKTRMQQLAQGNTQQPASEDDEMKAASSSYEHEQDHQEMPLEHASGDAYNDEESQAQSGTYHPEDE